MADRKDHRKIRDPAEDLDAFIFRSCIHPVIQDPAHQVAPLRILLDPVDVLLRRAAVSDQQDLFLVETLAPHVPEDIEDRHAHDPLKRDVDEIEDQEGKSGIILLPYDIQGGDDQQKAERVCLDHVGEHQPSPLHPQRRIQVERLVQQQVGRNDEDQKEHVLLKTLGPDCRIGKYTYKAQCPGRCVGQRNDENIDQYMQTAEMLFIIDNQFCHLCDSVSGHSSPNPIDIIAIIL